MRESPVASEKTAVDQARRRPCAGSGSRERAVVHRLGAPLHGAEDS